MYLFYIMSFFNYNLIWVFFQNWYSYKFTCLQLLEFVKRKGTCIQLLMKHLGTSAIMDLTLKLVTITDVEMKSNVLSVSIIYITQN